MFQMYPGALDTEMARRREVTAATMRAMHGRTDVRARVPDIARFRHVVTALAAAVTASAR